MSNISLEETKLHKEVFKLLANLIENKIEPHLDKSSLEKTEEGSLPQINKSAQQSINSEYTQQDIYLENTSKYMINIINVFEEMDRIPIFLEQINESTNKENKLSKNDKLIYHTNNHLTRIITIRDLLAQLINQIYQLGIKKRKRSLYNILDEHSNELEDKFIEFIKSFRDSLNNISAIRNDFIHNGEHYKNRQMLDLKVFELLEYNKQFRDISFRKILLEEKQKITENNKNLKQLIKIAYEHLYFTFIKKYDSMNK